MNTATRLARDYGFDRIDIPILEYTELFERGVGTASDVFVQKEMYTIAEPNGRTFRCAPSSQPESPARSSKMAWAVGRSR